MSSFPPAREEEREKLLSQSVGSGVLKVGTPPTSTPSIPSAGSPMSKLSGSIGNGISYVGGRVKEGLNRTRTLSLEAGAGIKDAARRAAKRTGDGVDKFGEITANGFVLVGTAALDTVDITLDLVGQIDDTNRRGRVAALIFGICALLLVACSSTALSTNFSVIKEVHWIATNASDHSTDDYYLGLRRLAYQTAQGNYSVLNWDKGNDTDATNAIICSFANHAGIQCDECFTTMDRMVIFQLIAVYTQLVGCGLAASRIRAANNGLLIRLLAFVASSVAGFSNAATLFSFHQSCFPSDSAQKHGVSFGWAFICAWSAMGCNVLQSAMHLVSMHNNTLTFTAGTPFKFFCYAENSCCCKRRRMLDGRKIVDSDMVQEPWSPPTSPTPFVQQPIPIINSKGNVSSRRMDSVADYPASRNKYGAIN